VARGGAKFTASLGDRREEGRRRRAVLARHADLAADPLDGVAALDDVALRAARLLP
jgi:hypothetical protein